ncbi:hypothetical protein D3C81_1646120 [compost metagenome]
MQAHKLLHGIARAGVQSFLRIQFDAFNFLFVNDGKRDVIGAFLLLQDGIKDLRNISLSDEHTALGFSRIDPGCLQCLLESLYVRRL